MALFESAWDGDVEGVIHALESGVCVDVTRPVSHYQYDPKVASANFAWQAKEFILVPGSPP